MRVCFLTTSYPRFSGDLAGHFVRELAVQLAGMGVEVTVVAPDDPAASDAPAPPAVRRVQYAWPRGLQRLCYGDGIPHNLRSRKLAWLNLPPFFAAFAVEICRQARACQLVHAHWGILGAMAVALRPLHRRPVVVTSHGSDVRSSLGAVRRATAWAIRRADAVTAVSPELTDECRHARPRGPCIWIPNGVNMPAPHELAALRAARPAGGGVRFITVGRLIPERRHVLLVEAMAQLRTRFPDASLTIVGDGPEMPRLRSRAGELGLGQTVAFTGAVAPARVGTYLAQSDVYVSPTTVESFGLAVAEAAAHELAVITTDVGFPPRLVAQGHCGHVVKPDDAQGLLAAMEQYCRQQGLAQTFGAALRARVEELGLTWPAAAGKLAQLYSQCVP
jgi:glycosyltransferase involved in cell wall biosynthesis